MKDIISETLGAASPIAKIEPSRELAVIEDNNTEEINEAKDNIKQLIAEVTPLVPDMMELVKHTESPRIIEATTSYIKMIAELNKMVVDMSKNDGKIPVVKTGTENNQYNTNIVFSGTMQDVLEKIKEAKKVN